MNKLIEVGYWKSNDPDNEKYPDVKDYICLDWDSEERTLVLKYIKEQGKHYTGWMGYSSCRLCHFIKNGVWDDSDGTYIWPEGFVHYIEKHNVKPPQDFIEHIQKEV